MSKVSEKTNLDSIADSQCPPNDRDINGEVGWDQSGAD